VIRPAAPTIHLDTSFLIRALDPSSDESVRLLGWLRDRRALAVSTLAWGEFLCGPLGDEDRALALRLVQRRIALGTAEAAEAARLFNHGGRRRRSFADCVIAATAVLDGAELATSDPRDFDRLRDAGVKLAG